LVGTENSVSLPLLSVPVDAENKTELYVAQQ